MGVRSGNPDWQDGSAGGTPITAQALQNMEQAIDDLPAIDQVAWGAVTDKPVKFPADLTAGTNVSITYDADGTATINSSGGGGGGGNASFRYYVSSAWQARGSDTNPVTFVSTKDVAAPNPTDMVLGDMWIRHPNAVETP